LSSQPSARIVNALTLADTCAEAEPIEGTKDGIHGGFGYKPIAISASRSRQALSLCGPRGVDERSRRTFTDSSQFGEASLEGRAEELKS
jgi:hypothetical protein